MNVPPSTLPGINMPEVMRRFGGNWTVIQMLIKQFVSLHENIESQAEDCFSRQDYAALRELAHKIKGAAANLAASEVRETAQGLEAASQQGDIAGMEEGLQRLRAAMTTLRGTARSVA